MKLDLGLVSAARLHVFVFPGSSETKRKIKDLKVIFCLLIYHAHNQQSVQRKVTYPPPPKKKEIVKQKNVNCKFLSIHETLSSQELA